MRDWSVVTPGQGPWNESCTGAGNGRAQRRPGVARGEGGRPLGPEVPPKEIVPRLSSSTPPLARFANHATSGEIAPRALAEEWRIG